MIKLTSVLLFFTLMLQAEQVEVSADFFEADEQTMTSILQGNVLLQKGEDTVHASTLTISFDAQNKPIKYLAEGQVNFNIKTNMQDFEGHAQSLLYNPKTHIYAVSGNAFLHDKKQDRKLYGERIMIDRNSGKSSIKGAKNRPVKFIFHVQED